ncbi:hypothetical protein A2U01_0104010, partial [Trifolium medium]|nr:hypothetical protein [Trifolium medium]
MGGSKTAAVGR